MRSEALVCCRCDLCHGRTHVVFGEGPSSARAMIVGEGPGAEEDIAGRPFVGRAGRLLDHVLAEAGLKREALWVTNIVRCRPTVVREGRVQNRAPRISEVRACDIWTSATYEFVAPDFIMCLGGAPAQALISKAFRIGEGRGQWHEGRGGRPTAATYHPAYALRLRGEDRIGIETVMIEDLKMLKSSLDGL